MVHHHHLHHVDQFESIRGSGNSDSGWLWFPFYRIDTKRFLNQETKSPLLKEIEDEEKETRDLRCDVSVPWWSQGMILVLSRYHMR